MLTLRWEEVVAGLQNAPSISEKKKLAMLVLQCSEKVANGFAKGKQLQTLCYSVLGKSHLGGLDQGIRVGGAERPCGEEILYQGSSGSPGLYSPSLSQRAL